MNTVIFDFDGTIADSFDHVLGFLLVASGRSHEQLTPEQRQQLKGLSMQDLALHLGIPKWRLPLLYFQGKAAMSKRMTGTVLFDGMEEVIKTLHAEQYRLYIISSNSRRNITRFLLHHGMSAYFTKVYGSVGWFGKGLVLRKVLKQNGLEASKTVYIGDEVRDVIGAHLASMPSIAVEWGFSSKKDLLEHSPTLLVRTPGELQKVLVEWGKDV